MDEHGEKVLKVYLVTLLIVWLLIFFIGLSSGARAGIALVLSLFIASIVAIIVAIIYGAARRGQQIGNIIEEKHKEIKKKKEMIKDENEPMQILKKRYAKGEITKDQYIEMGRDLRG